MSSVNQALLLPELLLRVINHVNEASLTSVIQVSKLWFEIGTDVLWRSVHCSVLTKVARQRRQMYASKIQRLEFNGEEEVVLHEQFKSLQFSSIRSVSLDSYRPKGALYPLRQYLRPSLETFELYGAELDDALMQDLQVNCWRLQRILIDNPGSKLTPAGFFRYISGARSLQYMTFMYGMEHLLTDELFIHCGGRGNLLELRIGRLLQPELLKSLKTPFPTLQSLGADVPSSSIALICQIFRHLKLLELHIKDVDNSVLEPIASILNLQELDLRFDCDTILSTEQLLSLGELSRLERLYLEPGPSTPQLEAVTSSNSPFRDSDFNNLISRLPKLRDLHFEVQSNLTAVSLASLGIRCPLLEKCNMPNEFNFEVFMRQAGEKILFSSLTELFLGGLLRLVADGHESNEEDLNKHVNEALAVMKHHFPRLEIFSATSDDKFCASLEEKITEWSTDRTSK